MTISLPTNSKMLTKEFTFGVATASFQIEGANNVDGRLGDDSFAPVSAPTKVEDDFGAEIKTHGQASIESSLFVTDAGVVVLLECTLLLPFF